MAFLVSGKTAEPGGEGSPAPHPLDPLTAAEIEAASEAVKAAQGLGPAARFVYVSLYEPAKAEVIAFEAAQAPAPDRLVKAVIRDRAQRATYEAIVALPGGDLRSWRQVPGVQPSVISRSSSPPRTPCAGTNDGRRRCASAASPTSACA